MHPEAHFDSLDFSGDGKSLCDPFAQVGDLPSSLPFEQQLSGLQSLLERSEEELHAAVERIKDEARQCCLDEIETEMWGQVLSRGESLADAWARSRTALREWLDDMEMAADKQAAAARLKHIIRNWRIRRGERG